MGGNVCGADIAYKRQHEISFDQIGIFFRAYFFVDKGRDQRINILVAAVPYLDVCRIAFPPYSVGKELGYKTVHKRNTVESAYKQILVYRNYRNYRFLRSFYAVRGAGRKKKKIAGDKGELAAGDLNCRLSLTHAYNIKGRMCVNPFGCLRRVFVNMYFALGVIIG